MTNRTLLAAVAAFACLAVKAEETNDWENTAINSRFRLPPRTYSMPLARVQDAFTAAIEPETPFKLSLNGNWKFSWAGSPDLRVKDFWRDDFDDAMWCEIDVPSCVEMRGWGSPGYTNVRYPHAMAWPKILDRDTDKPDYNPVSSYRTRFTLPADWKGRDVILRFDGVYSAYYVWVNGVKVGYAEDSKLPSEFDITKYVKADGQSNTLCVEVYRWCDGSYLEDQDMFRFSGIFRDVTLWAKPQNGIWDFNVKTHAEDADYRRWSLTVETDGADSVALYDAAHKKVADLTQAFDTIFTYAFEPKTWSAETPYLYTLVLKKGADIRMKRIGFKEQKIVGHTFLVNGKAVKFKGVNRHESSAENGRAITFADMVADITLMKRYNINTVRTCHYPDHHLWYDLCDRYGIYIVAEANVEGHEPGYKEKGLGQFPAWDHSIVERNERNAFFHRNNVCVTLWSMGNETGHGDCFRHAIAAVRKIDPSRPIHWERGNVDADVDSRMYPTVEWLNARGRLGDGKATEEDKKDMQGHTPDKCFFMCEYAHAMGNAIGNFQEYWDAFYAYESLSGGCIWDWVDQAVWKETGKIDRFTGKPERFLAYGGDFDEVPNDGPFCCNGIIRPDRQVTSKLLEVAHVHRNLVVTRTAQSGGNPFAVVFDLWNRYCFTSADQFAGSWQLRENGVVTKQGAFETPAVAPLSHCRFTVPGLAEAIAAAKPDVELFVDFAFATRADDVWAPKGWVVARDQIALGGSWHEPAAKPLDTMPVITQDARTLTVVAEGTKAVFCRRSGTLTELTMNGRTILKDLACGVVAGPQLTCARAFTDNDIWMRDGANWSENRRVGGVYSRGLTQLRYHARPLVIAGSAIKTCVEVTGSKSAGFTYEATWNFRAGGRISIQNRVIPHGTMPPALPRLGLSLKLDDELENMSYYGRGPNENYIDRKTGSFIGLWKSTVTEQYEPYVRPQDNGYKSDVRWVAFAAKDGKGVRFAASEPMYVQALHYDREDLEFAHHRNGERRHRAPLVPTREVRLNLDVRQTGLGGASCGPRPMAKYVFDPNQTVSWTLDVVPFGK